MSSGIITMLTDFGTRDGYVGSCKGVIKELAPRAEIVDITHDIEVFNVKAAALTLYNYYEYFPKGTIHMAVVDPGVGSERQALVLRTARHTFVGPDNGLFHLIMENEAHTLYAIRKDLFLGKVKHATFHGRDLFAPVAARLVLGQSPEDFARPLPQRTDHGLRPFRKDDDGRLVVPVMSVDHFGNIIFAINRQDLERMHKQRIKSLHFRNREIRGLVNYYAQEDEGGVLALWNSRDFLEIAVNGGHAAHELQVDPRKDTVILEVE